MAQPGGQTRIGIQFETDQGWHIYWKNPGDSGEPPRIRWQLPEGVTIGPLEWPAPVRLTTSAGTDYDYEGNAVLVSTLQLPAAARPGTIMEVAGDLRWLVCRDICIPQRAELNVPLRVANVPSVNSSAHVLLTAATERLPKPLPDSFHASVTGSTDALHLSLNSARKITHTEFFPAEPEQIDDAAPQAVTSHGDSIQLELKKSDHLRSDPERLNGVLVLNGRDTYQLDVPIRSSAAHQRREQ